MIYIVVRQYECGLTIVEGGALTPERALLELTKCAGRFQARNPTIPLDIRGNVFYFEGVTYRVLTTEFYQ